MYGSQPVVLVNEEHKLWKEKVSQTDGAQVYASTNIENTISLDTDRSKAAFNVLINDQSNTG